MSSQATAQAPATYRLFGLAVASYRAVTGLELRRISGRETADVEIVAGQVATPAQTVKDDCLELARVDDGLFLHVPGVARFHIANGRRVTVMPEPGVADGVVDLFLTGTVLGAVLHQRALLPIHCNAVRVGAQAFLFCGDSGAGKSTLAAWFEAQGYDLFTDDVCAVRFDASGRALASAGLPRLRLWRESIEALGRGREPARPLPWEADKYELTMARLPGADLLPVGGIYHLQIDEGLAGGVESLTGLAAANALTSSIYRRRIADHVGRGPGYLADAMRLLATVPIFAFRRAWSFESFEAEARMIENHALQRAQSPRDWPIGAPFMLQSQMNGLSRTTLIDPDWQDSAQNAAI